MLTYKNPKTKVACLLVAAAVALAVLTGCGPSCEELGGRRVFSHFVPISTGKSVVLVAQYRCEGAQQ